MTSDTFIGRGIYGNTELFVSFDLRRNRFDISCSKLEKLLHLLCIAIKDEEKISFNEPPFLADNPFVTYLPLTQEQRKALEIMYERKTDMKEYPNPFVK